ncbi:MAG: glycerophosphodiester phosphodiesterase [Spirochaetales bacterium]|nr:glycerophosphodiester phosphodiesterase [Spirochaetales bacterium]
MLKPNFFIDNNGPLLFGHRGCSHAAPENTLAAFRLLKENGIPGVELDVRICATGEMVVFHDDDFKRIFGIEGTIEDTTFEALQKLDAGIHKGEQFNGERVPLMSEVFELLENTVFYDIELKNRQKTTGAQEAELDRLIKKYGLESNCIVSSFNPLSVNAFRKVNHRISRAVIYSATKELPWFLRNGEGRYISRSSILKPEHIKITRRFMCWYSKFLKYPVLTWTVDDPARAEELIKMGVSGIISNRPEDLKHLFNGNGK